MVASELGLGRILGVAGGPILLVVQEPDGQGPLRCNGKIMTARHPPACSTRQDRSATVQAGQVLRDPASGLRLLCVQAGEGAVTYQDRLLEVRSRAAPIPLPRRVTPSVATRSTC